MAVPEPGAGAGAAAPGASAAAAPGAGSGSPAGGPLAVSIDVAAIPARPVGAGRYVVELVRALAAHPEVAPTLLARRGDDERWRRLHKAAGVRAVAPTARPLRLAWEELALGRLLDSLPVQVHHGPHYSLPLRLSRPSVVTVHDCTFLDHPEWHERSKVLVFSHELRRAARVADVVVCPSRLTAERFSELCAPAGEVLVVPHGVDHERFRPSEAEEGHDDAVLARLAVRRPYLLHVGTLEPRKDVGTLLRAFAELAGAPGTGGGGAGSELSLVLAGPSGWGGAGIAAAESELPVALRRRVRRLGYVADADLPALMRRAACFVYASLEEGFGVPVLEALACGAPVVTSRGTVMAEVAGAAALCSVPGDASSLAAALAEALAGSDAAQRRREAGIERAATMTWEASARGHVEAYRLAAARARSTAGAARL
jgi:glycosyltransferase involved in cell wall biosynthesis